MKTSSEAKSSKTPPYVGFATFRNLLDRLHENGVPTQIDRKVMGSDMNGSVFSYLLSTLRFLGLVDANAMSQQSLEQLAAATGEDRKKLFREIFKSAYPFIFAPEAKFDLTKATDKTLLEKFTDYGTKDEVAKKCIAFFINAVHYAEIPISTYIHTPQQRASRAKTGKQAPLKSKGKASSGETENSDNEDQGKPLPPVQLTGEQTLMRDLIAQLDKMPADWTMEQREKWMNNIKEMMMIVRGDKTTTEPK